MKVSYKWLKEFVDLELSPEETAEKLTMIGLEVDGLDTYGSSLEGVIVGEVLDVEEHPNADKLHLCQVDLGKEKVQIVCGADNVAKGQKVPVATVGTQLPFKSNGEPLVIRKAKLRGEQSEGMICAEDELGISDDHSGIMVLDQNIETGTPFRNIVEPYEDHLFDIEITPNRPDATCHLGVARDLAAVLNLELNKPFDTEFEESKPLDDHIGIEIKNPDKCHRYVGKMVTGVEVGESPDWLTNKLKAIGVRPVNNIVDATNYVLYEMGQPLHAFDYNKIGGKKIVVKDYEKPIEFETLDHVTRKCSPGTLFICDANGPVAIAGVIGGLESEVGDETTDVLIESAYFDPGSIRKTAKEQNIQTDASYRFERGIDPNMQRVAAERAAALIADIGNGTIVDGCTDVHPVETEPKELNLRLSYVNRLLGTDLSLKDVEKILKGLELKVVSRKKDTLTLRIPTFRPDLEREVDLIEEVGRLYDYNKIPSPTHVKFSPPEPISDHEKLMVRLRELARSFRMREISSNSLMSKKDAEQFGDLEEMIHTLNPISKDMTTLRPSLQYGFLKAVSYNFNRKTEGVRFFEIGNVFWRSEEGSYYEGIAEEVHLLIGIAGKKSVEHWKTEPGDYDLFDLKSIVTTMLEQLGIEPFVEEHADGENRLSYRVDDREIGHLSVVGPQKLDYFEIDSPAFYSEFSIDRIEEVLASKSLPEYESVSKYPSFEFDLAVVVDDDVGAGELRREIRNQAGDMLQNLQVFDVFEGASLGKNRKSIAFRLSFLDKNKTLTINDVEPIINKVLKALEKRFSAELRS